MSKNFMHLIEELTQQKTNHAQLDMAATVYQDTDYLLPHDDQLDSRAIAYMVYLSTLNKNDGGALALFSNKENKLQEITKRIIPQFNTFFLFKVSSLSLHTVEEVIGDVQRFAISGWFHADN